MFLSNHLQRSLTILAVSFTENYRPRVTFGKLTDHSSFIYLNFQCAFKKENKKQKRRVHLRGAKAVLF